MKIVDNTWTSTMIKIVPRITRSAMGGFGLGLVLAVLVTVATASPTTPITVSALFTNPFTLVFTILGLGLGFEE